MEVDGTDLEKTLPVAKRNRKPASGANGPLPGVAKPRDTAKMEPKQRVNKRGNKQEKENVPRK